MHLLRADAVLVDRGLGRVPVGRAQADATVVELARVEEVRREPVPQEEQRRRGGARREAVVDQAGRVERELILAADAVEHVVEDPVAAPQHQRVAHLVDDAHARREVVRVGPHQAAVLERAVRRGDDAAAPRGIEVELVVVGLERGGDEVVAQPQVERQLRAEAPVVADEEGRRPVALVGHEHVRELRVRGVAEQVVGDRVAGVAPAVAHRAARGRDVHVLVPHRREHVDPELELVGAREPRQRVQELPLARVLELRQEVGRAHAPEPAAAEVTVDRDADHPAGDQRVVRDTRHLRLRRRQLAEGLLDRVRVDRAPREAELVHDRGAEDARPAEHEAVRGDRLVAEGRRAGAVDQAAEGARQRALAVGVDVAQEEGALVRGAEVDLAGEPVGVVDHVGVGPDVVVGVVRVGLRQEREDRGGHGVDAARGDDVARRTAGR